MIMNALNCVQSDTFIYIYLLLNPADHHPARITKADKDFVKMLGFKDIKFPVKIRDIHKKYPIYISKKMLRRKTC